MTDERNRSVYPLAADRILRSFAAGEEVHHELAFLGYEDIPVIAQNLRLLRARMTEAFSEILPALLEYSLASPHPVMAINNLERFVACAEDEEGLASFIQDHPEVLYRMLILFGSSQSLSNFTMAAPQQTLEYLSSPSLLRHPRDRETMSRELSEAMVHAGDTDAAKSILRRFRHWEYIRIVLRDLLAQGDLSDITTEISNIADVCLQTAFDYCDAVLTKRYGTPRYIDPDGALRRCRFVVLGMGKLGGGELNFSSDIDLIFVYSSDNGETTGVTMPPEEGDLSQGYPSLKISNHEYFVRLSEQLVSVIGAATSEGVVFRVDTRLRPEGDKGDLASSLRSHEIYYESWGQTWERAALLKTRPVAGDEALGQEFLQAVQPFVYRKYLDFHAIDEIREMKQKINRNVALKGREKKDVKLGYGGIREIEFFVQALQLLYGGKDPWVRERNTLRALHRVAQKGYISYEEESRLSQAYHFLRKLEHRIQFLNEQQTQVLPDDAEELYYLSRRMGYPAGSREETTARLLKDYAFHAVQVRSIYDQLFSGPRESPPRDSEDLDKILQDLIGEEEAIGFLSRYPFQDPRKAYRNILLLRDGPVFSHQTRRSREIFVRIFPHFFAAITAAPDPDLAINHLESLITSLGARETFYAFFQNNPKAVEPLVLVLGSSEYFARLLIRHPDLVELFLDPEQILEKKSADQLSQELMTELHAADLVSERLDILRRFKVTEELRIGVLDLLDVVSPDASMHHLASLAEVCVQGALQIAAEEIHPRHGSPREKSHPDREGAFCVVAVGKFGSSELTYGSDLDLFFLYSEEGRTLGPQVVSNHEYFALWASKIITNLTLMTREGSVFRVDSRLRPSGAKGPLAQSLEAFTHYMEQESSVWERQVLTRARVVAGSKALGLRFIETCHRLIYPAAPAANNPQGDDADSSIPPDRLRGPSIEIALMRDRMEAELSQEDSVFYDIKIGWGGIVDIEFLVQYLLLAHAGRCPSLRETHTHSALEALAREDLISVKECSYLRRAHTFLRTLESRLRMVSNLPTSRLPKDPQKIRPIALRMGFQDKARIVAEQKLLKEFIAYRKGVRKIFDRHLRKM